jgi:general secretion pathway protein M
MNALDAELGRVRAWWASLAERERRVLGAGGVVLALVILYLFAWEPLAAARQQRHVELQAARALATQLDQLAAIAPRGAGAPTAGAGQSLLAIVDQSRKASAIDKPPTRLQPEGDDTVRIWLEDVPFEALVRWLGDLQARYGVRVDSADIERESGPGLVSARLTLVRG